jgi:hypothetical protein
MKHEYAKGAFHWTWTADEWNWWGQDLGASNVKSHETIYYSSPRNPHYSSLEGWNPRGREKQTRPVVEKFKLASLELQITCEKGKHSYSVEWNSEKVQKFDFDSVSNAEFGTLGIISNNSDTVCSGSDNSTQHLHVNHHKQTNKQKEPQKLPRQKSVDFYGLNIPYPRVNLCT